MVRAQTGCGRFCRTKPTNLLKRRFAIIQVWRAINRPIQSNPLALADARSVTFDDLMVAERRYPHRVGPDLSAQIQSAAPLDLFSRDAP